MHYSKIRIPPKTTVLTDSTLTGKYRYRFSKWLCRPILQLQWTWTVQTNICGRAWNDPGTVEQRYMWEYATLDDLTSFIAVKGLDVFNVEPSGNCTGKRTHKWLRGKNRLMLLVEKELLGLEYSPSIIDVVTKTKWFKAKPGDLYPHLIAND